MRFVQVYHNNWDHHGNLPGRMKDQCADVDQPCHALIQDLKRVGLLDSTLVIWGGEFGRTIYSQGGLSKTNYGRDHHPRCFSMWMAGGGSKGASPTARPTTSLTTSSKTPSTSATSTHHPAPARHRPRTLHLPHLGLDQKLTGVEKANVIKALLA